MYTRELFGVVTGFNFDISKFSEEAGSRLRKMANIGQKVYAFNGDYETLFTEYGGLLITSLFAVTKVLNITEDEKELYAMLYPEAFKELDLCMIQ